MHIMWEIDMLSDLKTLNNILFFYLCLWKAHFYEKFSREWTKTMIVLDVEKQ